MIPLAWLCLLIPPHTVDLVDEVYRIPAGEWRYVEVSLRQRPASISAQLEAQGKARDLRAAILTRADLGRLGRDRPYGVLASSPPGPSARLGYYVRDPGEYAVVLDNRDSDAPATVRLHVWLDFGPPFGQSSDGLSPQRRLTVILVSFIGFFAIVTWSARRLLQSIRR
jgi:hypothetical protein